MNYVKYGLGIDMAMDTFKVCLSLLDHQQKVSVVSTGCFTNNVHGFQKLLKWVQLHQKFSLPLIFLVEATGIYHEQLAWYLFEKNGTVVVILPNKAKKYKEALGIKSKNDAIDAYGLSRLACEQHFKCWQPVSKNLYKLRVLTRQVEAVSGQTTILKNQLHALLHGMYRIKEVERLLAKQLSVLVQHKSQLETAIVQLIESDPVLQNKCKNIVKIKGLGIQSLAIIIAETDGFALTQNLSQITSYAGYDVVENQSGNRVGKTKISKKGNGHIRRALHFPALNVVRYGQANFKEFYERINQRTNIKMKGYVAVQRKLLCLIFTLWKKDEAFINNNTKTNSGNKEAELSFALAPQERAKKPVRKRASTKVKAPLDKLPSTSRRKLSFA